LRALRLVLAAVDRAERLERVFLLEVGKVPDLESKSSKSWVKSGPEVLRDL
jgi:hypothetical protein